MAEQNLTSDQKEQLSAILYMVQKDKFHILEVEVLCKALGKKLAFDITGPKGSFRCRFVDPHYGIFEKINSEQILHVKQFVFISDVHCENLEVEDV
jgi:hypothetical protein